MGGRRAIVIRLWASTYRGGEGGEREGERGGGKREREREREREHENKSNRNMQTSVDLLQFKY